MRIIKILIYVIFLITAPAGFIFSFDDPSYYSVPLKNFSDSVYTEEVSKYRILIAGNEFILPDTGTQKILKTSSDNSFFTLLVQEGKGNSPKIPDQSLKNYLSDSRLLNIDDPGIQKLKQRFRNSKDIIVDVERFVYSHISNKITGIPIISAAEILRDKSGDCTEHAVLAVSILRSMGVPAVALVGMLLSEEFEGSRNVFVYHMWAEAYVNGRWILVDATRPGQKHGNRYIAFAYHSLQTEMPLQYLKAVYAIQSFSVEYVK